MDWLFLPMGIIFALLGAGCLLTIVFSLPGTWIMIALAAGLELFDGVYLPPGENTTFGWAVIGVAALLALLGELVELAAGALGARTGGGTRRGMWGALIGGILGAFLLALPIPVAGILIGAVLGTFAGAVVGEMSHDRATFRGSLKPAAGATVGRVLGTVAKMGVGVAVWVGLSVTAIVP